MATHDEGGEPLRIRVRRSFKIRLGADAKDLSDRPAAPRMIEGEPP